MFVILAQRTGITNEKDIRPKGQEIRDGGSLSKKVVHRRDAEDAEERCFLFVP